MSITMKSITMPGTVPLIIDGTAQSLPVTAYQLPPNSTTPALQPCLFQGTFVLTFNLSDSKTIDPSTVALKIHARDATNREVFQGSVDWKGQNPLVIDASPWVLMNQGQGTRLLGPLTWSLVSSNGTTVWSQALPLEIYVPTPKMLADHPTGISDVDLRLEYVLPTLASGAPYFPKDRPTLMANCVQAAFSPAPGYDVYYGNTNYGTYNFRLKQWLMASAGFPGYSPCNCLDAAAFTSLLLWQNQFVLSDGSPKGGTTVGPTPVFYYTSMGYDPVKQWTTGFGYLKETNLRGIGACNNPFYASINGDNCTAASKTAVCPPTINCRTAFGGHAVCMVIPDGSTTPVICDATAGPHIGKETLAQYLSSAVDDQVPASPVVHSAPNFSDQIQVMKVDGVSLSSPTAAPKPAAMAAAPTPNAREAEFRTLVKYPPAGPTAAPGPLAVRWPSPAGCPTLAGWSVSSQDTTYGHPECHRAWTLTRGQESAQVDVWVASDGPATAHSRYLTLGSSHHMPASPFSKGPADLGESSAQSLIPRNQVYIWVDRTVSFQVASRNSDVDLLSVARWSQALLAGAVAGAKPPTIGGASATPSTIKVGQSTTVSVACDPGAVVLVDGARPFLRLAQGSGATQGFVGLKPGVAHLQVIVADRATLLSSARDVVASVGA